MDNMKSLLLTSSEANGYNMTRLTVKCKIDQPFVERPMAGPFDYIVYNKHTGYVVAATYSPQMARAILQGISATPEFMDSYAITESFKYTEPKV